MPPFLVKQLLKSQLKNVPEAQKQALMKVVEENPDFLMDLVTKAQKKMQEGMSQQQALMEVVAAHKEELKGLL